MEKQTVFSQEREVRRLVTQNRLMHGCEAPLFCELFAGRSGLCVLDVGSNNGDKTVRWFSDSAVKKVLGLEYNTPLALQAQQSFGDERFSFVACDVEAPDFSGRLRELMQREGIPGFDVIYLSFVLSHLRAPDALLRHLRTLLRPGGILVAAETDDSRCALAPEGGALLRRFLEILARDPLAGDRGTGARLEQMLHRCGFAGARRRCDAIAAGPGETEKKADIFEMFFSYLPEDMTALQEMGDFRRDARWLSENFSALQRAVCAPESQISMGISVVTGTTEPEF